MHSNGLCYKFRPFLKDIFYWIVKLYPRRPQCRLEPLRQTFYIELIHRINFYILKIEEYAIKVDIIDKIDRVTIDEINKFNNI